MDNDTEIIVEDGEITDDEDDDIEAYKPLERPAELINTHINTHRPQTIEQNVSDDESVASSDSDSDKGFSSSAKRKKPNKLPKNHVPRKNKYDIWSSRAHEDLLTETIAGCSVTKMDRRLGVESYNHKSHMKNKRQGIKRRLGDKNVNFHNRERDDSNERKGEPRAILDLCTTLSNTNEEIAKDIANKLVEEKDDLILRIVTVLGKEKAIELFCDTQEIESKGGMLIMNGSRRRTPGGVYIYLLKNNDHIPMDKINEIFYEDREIQKNEKKIKDKLKKKKLKEKIKALYAKEKMIAHQAKEKLVLHAEEKLIALPTKGELILKEESKIHKEVVNNPPPSPASIDLNVQTNPPNNNDRILNSYEDESFLDIGMGNEMDMF